MRCDRRSVGQPTSLFRRSWIVLVSVLTLITPLTIGIAQPGQLASGASTMLKTGVAAQRSSSHGVKTRVSGPAATIDQSEPSGQAPPSATAMAGYVQTYVNDFTGTSVPTGWEV